MEPGEAAVEIPHGIGLMPSASKLAEHYGQMPYNAVSPTAGVVLIYESDGGTSVGAIDRRIQDI